MRNLAKGKGLPVLQVGDTGIYVTLLQIALTLLGYDPGPVDGVFGPMTQAAVMAFQTDACLRVDGIVGPRTWRALAKALSKMPLPPALPTLSVGSTGVYVSLLQAALTILGYDPGPIDGVFGSLTEAAVMAFQRDNGLVVDGIVGPMTWGALLKELKCVLPDILRA